MNTLFTLKSRFMLLLAWRIRLHYGDILQLTETGVKVSHRRCSPIGINDGSQVWGAILKWKEPKYGLSEAEQYHLLLSPIPFQAWPRAFRIEINIPTQSGALHSAAEVLRTNLLNLLSTHCTISGFEQATWTVIAEHLSIVDSDYNELVKVLKTNDDTKPGIFLANKCFAMCREIESALKTLPSMVLIGQEDAFYRIEDIKNGDDKKMAGSHYKEGATCRWLRDLAYLWLNRDSVEVPPFIYNANSGMLTSQRPDVFLQILRDKRIAVPSQSIAMFNRAENYFRVELPIGNAPRRIEIDVNYLWNAKNKNSYKIATAGTVENISNAVNRAGFDLVWADNMLYRRSYTSDSNVEHNQEAGRVHMIANVSSVLRDKSIVDLSATCKQAISELELQNRGTKIVVEVNEIQSRTMFLSTRFNYWRGGRGVRYKKIKDLICRYGFSPTTADDDVADMKDSNSIARDAIERIKNCATFLQIIPRLDKTITEEQLQWILYERGAASAIGVPMACCVQVSSRHWDEDIAEWQKRLRIEMGRRIYPYDPEDHDESFIGSIELAVQYLAKAVELPPYGK